MKKVCFKCHNTKQLSEFYKHPRMSDGHLGKCKDCTKLDVTIHRATHLEAIQAYDRRRYHEPERQKQIQRNSRKRGWAWDSKRAAQKKVRNAIDAGRIKRQPCEVCGSKRSHAHHHDYSKPLEVKWLCAIHHFASHRKYDYEALIKSHHNLKAVQTV